MAQQPNPLAVSENQDVLGSATFRSVLPTLDAILDVLYTQSGAENPPQGVEASAQVAQKVMNLSSLPEHELCHLSISYLTKFSDHICAALPSK